MPTNNKILEKFSKEMDESFDTTRKEINRIFNIMIFVAFSIAAICGIMLLIKFKPN